MENVMSIGAKIDKQSVENLAGFVKSVFESGKATGMDQSTIVAALRLGAKMADVSGVSVSDCNFIGEKNITVEAED